MREEHEHGQFADTLAIEGESAFPWVAVKLLGLLPKGWLRGRDLNPRPLGYEPNELPGCSTPRRPKVAEL
jgi:hypothetical protein